MGLFNQINELLAARIILILPFYKGTSFRCYLKEQKQA